MFSQNSSSLLLLAGAVLALWLVMRRGTSTRQPAWRQSPATDDQPRRFGSNSAAPVAEPAPADFLRWQVEMHETARELKGQLDSKLAALQALVIMARQESERLEAALAQCQSLESPPPGDTLARLAALAAPDQLAEETALAAAADALSPAAARADPFAGRDDDRVASEIRRLADQGLSAAEIATQLRLPLGEVELRLSLRPR